MQALRRTLAVTAVTAVTAVVGAASPEVCGADPSAQPDRIVAFPGMSIVQGEHRCTLGYVDPVARTGITAGHCDAAGPITDLSGHTIGDSVSVGRSLPAGGSIRPNDAVSDYESINFVPEADLSNTLPNHTRLRISGNVAPVPGLPVCLTGSVSGESCGKIDTVNSDWFTMTDINGEHGDSGGPVYTVTGPGEAQLVGIYSMRWGGHPAGMSWPAIAAQLGS